MDHLLPTILVPAFDPGTFEDALRAAAAIAIRHGSMVEAVHVRDDFSDGPDLGELWLTGGLSEQLSERARAVDAEFKTRLTRVCESTGLGRNLPGAGGAVVTFQSVSGPMPRAIAKRSRAASLIVTARGATDKRKAEALIVEALLEGSGRPCLVVPTGVDTAPRRPVVCWNGSVEASRAMFGAMPLILQAEDVSIVTIGDLPTDVPSPEAVATLLRRSGAHKVTVAQYPDDQDRFGSHSDQIEQHATEFGADLLVIGAYSRPRWEERVFGGVTRKMLFRPARPILFA